MSTSLHFPPISFGGNVFGWTLDEKASFRMLDMLLERGLTFIDTADVYGSPLGQSEIIIGKWLKQRHCRDKIKLATKAGRTYTQDQSGKKIGGKNNSPDYLHTALNNSLKRLQTDYVDLFYIHYDDEITPLNEVLTCLGDMQNAGNILHLGASNYSAERLLQALKLAEQGYPKFEVLQTEYNLVRRREFETELAPICQQYSVKTATYFSLASGFLTGKYRTLDSLTHHPRLRYTAQYLNASGTKVLAILDELTQKYQVSHAVVALAWLLQQKSVNTCLVSATRVEHLNDFETALHFQFDREDFERLSTSAV